MYLSIIVAIKNLFRIVTHHREQDINYSSISVVLFYISVNPVIN